jgi:nitrogen regulatory protein PII
MTKIEIIHNKEILKLLKTSIRKKGQFGFTTLTVTEGYGPQKGEYKEDHFGDEQYLSIILVKDDEEAVQIIQNLRRETPSNKFLAIKSNVTKLT